MDYPDADALDRELADCQAACDRLQTANGRYRAFVAAWDLLEDIHGATIMATRDDYTAAILSVRDTRAALDGTTATPGVDE